MLEEDRFDRRVYILVDNEDASIYQNTVVVYDTKFEPVTTFTLLRNCTNVTQFNATKIIPLSNGNIALRGVFKFDSSYFCGFELRGEDGPDLVRSFVGDVDCGGEVERRSEGDMQAGGLSADVS